MRVRTAVGSGLLGATIFLSAVTAKAQTAIELGYIEAVAGGLSGLGYNNYANEILNDPNLWQGIIELGYTNCGAMARGYTPKDITEASLASTGGSGIQGAYALSTSLAAALTLCPEHRWMVDQVQ